MGNFQWRRIKSGRCRRRRDGFGAGLIIIDDPVKSRAEAECQTYRDNIWDWFNDDLYTRLEPEGAIILIQTRWHEDDLAGRLLRESQETGGEHWEVVSLPAVAGCRTRTCGSGWFNITDHDRQCL